MSIHPAIETRSLAAPDATLSAALAAEQAARAAAGAVLAQAAGWALFGSFYLDGQEFALDAACIREVVGMPERLTRLPLSPDCLEGIFMLRGAAIPVLNLARIFDPGAARAARDQRIAIVEHEDVLVGLVFDVTGEVLRVRPEQRHGLAQAGGTGVNTAVIAGALSLEDGERLVQVLDPSALIRIDNVPQVRAQSAARDAERLRFLRRAQGRKALAFRAGGMAFALAIDAVQEIIGVPELRSSVMLGKLCKGWLDLRGQAVGVVDLGALLQCAAPAGDPVDRRIMIVRVGDGLLGLQVDAVDDIRPYFDADVLAIPMLGTRRAAMFRGCLPNAERGDLLFLAHEHIFSESEVAEICAGHRRLYQHELDGAARAAGSSRRRVYLAFSLDTGWATDICQVREIVALQDGLTRPPGLPDCVHGMMQLRQQMICVVDLRRLYGMAPAPEDEAARAERRVLVLEHEGERYGVIVDRVDSILNLPDSQRRPSPQLLRHNGPQDMRQDAGEVLEVPAEGVDGVRTLFDRARFMTTLRAALDA